MTFKESFTAVKYKTSQVSLHRAHFLRVKIVCFHKLRRSNILTETIIIYNKGNSNTPKNIKALLSLTTPYSVCFLRKTTMTNNRTIISFVQPVVKKKRRMITCLWCECKICIEYFESTVSFFYVN